MLGVLKEKFIYDTLNISVKITKIINRTVSPWGREWGYETGNEKNWNNWGYEVSEVPERSEGMSEWLGDGKDNCI